MSTLEWEVRTFLEENYIMAKGGGDLEPDHSLVDMGVLDSIGVFALSDFIEETYGITLSDNELTPENLDSLNRIVAFINRKQSLDNPSVE